MAIWKLGSKNGLEKHGSKTHDVTTHLIFIRFIYFSAVTFSILNILRSRHTSFCSLACPFSAQTTSLAENGTGACVIGGSDA